MKQNYPWFAKELNPNSRCHFRKKAAAKAKQRGIFKILTKRFDIPPETNIKTIITFYPPTGHRRDLDNCLASLKSGIDGMCDKLNIDDRYLQPITIQWGDIVKHGEIKIELITK